MKYEIINENYTEIIPETELGETIEKCAMAIAKASFEFAKPEGLGKLQYRENGEMTWEDAEKYFVKNIRGVFYSVDYFQGRACKVTIFKDENGKIKFGRNRYSITKNDENAMLKRACQLIKEMKYAKV